jgi:bifunctional DNA-binding transcriptional regulator/antitoxin component of YhaV-PrlF toxin-antitoxin module
MTGKAKEPRRRRARRPGHSTISSKNQVTLPVGALEVAGLGAGDRVRVEARGPGELVLVREVDPVERFADLLRGVYGSGYLERLRDEWA